MDFEKWIFSLYLYQGPKNSVGFRIDELQTHMRMEILLTSYLLIAQEVHKATFFVIQTVLVVTKITLVCFIHKHCFPPHPYC